MIPTMEQTVRYETPRQAKRSTAGIDYSRGSHLPEPKKDESLSPYVIGCHAKIKFTDAKGETRTLRNPFKSVDVYGITFPQYRLPADASLLPTGDEQRRHFAPNLPVKLLSDSQVAAIKKRAKETPTRVFMQSSIAEDLPPGYHDLTLDQLIFIEPYTEGQDIWAIARKAHQQAVEIGADEEKRRKGADMVTEFKDRVAENNEQPERPESNGKVKKH